MNTGSGKRKYEDENLPMEINNPRKRFKLEDIIFDDFSVDQESMDKPIVQNTAVKRRYKLLTAVHLKKKYKYYCKKHDVTYLIESVRKETKESSKRSRDNFVKNFRDLSVSIKFQNFKEEKAESETIEDIDVPNIDMEINVEDREWSKDSPLSVSYATPLRRCSTNSNLVFDESDDRNVKENTEKCRSLPEELKKRFSAAAANFMDKANFSDEDENSDTSEDRCKSKRRKAKAIKCLVVTKLPGTNQLLFSETDDILESGIEDNACDGSNDCDCSDHENLRRKFLNFEYESSWDTDSDSFSDISEDQ